MTGAKIRHLGLGSATALVVANMIGVGVFTTSGFALADLGSRGAVLGAWIVGALLATCGALSYGALARRIPESGGEYTFLSATLHPRVGFLAGWVSMLAGFTAPIAVAALGLEAYLAGGFGLVLPDNWVGTGAIVGAGLLHGLDLRLGVFTQNAAVVVKLIAIAAFVSFAVAFAPPVTAAPSSDLSLSAFAVSLVWISFSYSGWNAAIYVGAEVADPDRNLPGSLLAGTLIVAVLYLALNAVFLFAAPFEQLAGRPDVGTVAAEAIGGPALRRALSGLVALALFTSVSAMVMAGPRVYARMAADGVLPARLAAAPDGRPPRAAVMFQILAALVVVWIAPLRSLLGYVGFTLSASAVATVIGLLILRRREGATRVPIPGYPVVPAIFVIGTTGAMIFMIGREPLEALAGFATVALGFVVSSAVPPRPARGSVSSASDSLDQ